MCDGKVDIRVFLGMNIIVTPESYLRSISNYAEEVTFANLNIHIHEKTEKPQTLFDPHSAERAEYMASWVQ